MSVVPKAEQVTVMHVQTQARMDPIIFREYDIRGVVGTELPIDAVYDLGCALAYYMHTKNSNAQVLAIGRDVRTHSDAIHAELCRALNDCGFDVVDIGVCTTPMLFFATHTVGVDGGLMITASHNPREYNGIKIVVGTDNVWGPEVAVIKRFYQTRETVTAQKQGTYTTYNVTNAYIAWLQQQFPRLQNSTLPMIFDCGNGAASVVMPQVVKAFGWSHAQLLYASPDGNFPHHDADPIHAKNMADAWQLMQQSNISIGIGFDGDADRMDALDENGNLIPGDMLMTLFAQQLYERQIVLPIVCDITASSVFTKALTQWGIKPVLAPCGSGNIKDAMHRNGALLGGELSCHFFFADNRYGFDDGIYAALRLLDYMHTTGKSLGTLCDALPKSISSPQYRITCNQDDKKKFIAQVHTSALDEHNVQITTVDGVRITWPYGWGLIRASNTQPVLVFRFEADTAEQLVTIKRWFADILMSQDKVNLYHEFGL